MKEPINKEKVNNKPELVIRMDIKIYSDGVVDISPIALNYKIAKSHAGMIEKAIDIMFMTKAMAGELDENWTIKQSSIIQPTPGQIGALNNAKNN